VAPSPRHPAELLGGVLEQRLNRIGTAAIEDAEIPPRRTGPVQPDILSAEDVDRVFGTDGALAARLRLQRSRRFAGICAATERDNETFQHRDVMKAGKTARFFGYGINGLFLPSQVMQAEKTFSSSFMKRPVRTMCGCVLTRHEKTSGCEPRLGWLRADHAISSPHFGRPS
jgi:hypothetical protein